MPSPLILPSPIRRAPQDLLPGLGGLSLCVFATPAALLLRWEV